MYPSFRSAFQDLDLKGEYITKIPICSIFGSSFFLRQQHPESRPRCAMASFTSEFVAAMIAVLAVATGSLLGGGTIEATADVSTGIAVLGLAVAVCNAFTREFRALRDRFGSAVLFAVLQMS